MFFIMELQHTMKLHPSFFGPNVRQFLRQKLISDVEGTCDGQYGYIICVLDDNELRIPPGKILPGQGSAEFGVRYRAIVWKPFKVGTQKRISRREDQSVDLSQNEVVDAIVSIVNKMGFFADAGPLSVFVSTHVSPPSHRVSFPSELTLP